MKIHPENIDDIVAILHSKFPSFGGGKTSNTNPISNALTKSPPMFAMGVDIKKVVEETIELYKQTLISK